MTTNNSFLKKLSKATLLPTLCISLLASSCGTEETASKLDSTPTVGSWESAGTGYLGNAFFNSSVGGFDMYICRYYDRNHGYLYGHIARGQTNCFVAWGNSHVSSSSYQVLKNNPRYVWKSRHTAGNNSFITGVCRDRSNKLNGRLVVNGNNYGSPENGVCYTAWGNSNFHTYDFDVLTVR